MKLWILPSDGLCVDGIVLEGPQYKLPKIGDRITAIDGQMITGLVIAIETNGNDCWTVEVQDDHQSAWCVERGLRGHETDQEFLDKVARLQR